MGKKIIIVLFVAAAALAGLRLFLDTDEPSQNSATEPVPREGWAYERYLALNQKTAENPGELDILFIGDSITQKWETTGKKVWDEFYGGRNVLNIGISGDRTQHILWRLENGNIDGIRPRVTVLMIGTNNSGRTRNTASEMLEGIKAVVTTIRASLPDTHLLVLGIPPIRREFDDQRGKILQVNQVLRKLDEEKKITFLDFGHLLVDMNGDIPEELMPDGIHLSGEGYRVWAVAMEPLLQKLLPE